MSEHSTAHFWRYDCILPGITESEDYKVNWNQYWIGGELSRLPCCIFACFIGVTTRLKMHAKCMLEQPTCSKWPKIGLVRTFLWGHNASLRPCNLWYEDDNVLDVNLSVLFYRLAAGNAFCQAARLHMQMQNKLDSATSFVDAGNAYKKSDPQGEKGPDNAVISKHSLCIDFCC